MIVSVASNYPMLTPVSPTSVHAPTSRRKFLSQSRPQSRCSAKVFWPGFRRVMTEK